MRREIVAVAGSRRHAADVRPARALQPRRPDGHGARPTSRSTCRPSGTRRTSPRIRTGVASDLLIHDVDLALRVFGAAPVSRPRGVLALPSRLRVGIRGRRRGDPDLPRRRRGDDLRQPDRAAQDPQPVDRGARPAHRGRPAAPRRDDLPARRRRSGSRRGRLPAADRDRDPRAGHRPASRSPPSWTGSWASSPAPLDLVAERDAILPPHEALEQVREGAASPSGKSRLASVRHPAQHGEVLGEHHVQREVLAHQALARRAHAVPQPGLGDRPAPRRGPAPRRRPRGPARSSLRPPGRWRGSCPGARPPRPGLPRPCSPGSPSRGRSPAGRGPRHRPPRGSQAPRPWARRRRRPPCRRPRARGRPGLEARRSRPGRPRRAARAGDHRTQHGQGLDQRQPVAQRDHVPEGQARPARPRGRSAPGPGAPSPPTATAGRRRPGCTPARGRRGRSACGCTRPSGRPSRRRSAGSAAGSARRSWHRRSGRQPRSPPRGSPAGCAPTAARARSGGAPTRRSAQVRSKNCPCWWMTSGPKSSSSAPTRRLRVGRRVNAMSKLSARPVSGMVTAGSRTMRIPSRCSSLGRVLVGRGEHQDLVTGGGVAAREGIGQVRAAADPRGEEVVDDGDAHVRPPARGARTAPARRRRRQWPPAGPAPL